uniref:cis-aconitate decarboxylase-like n=1 Tax=Oncorhynchus gorbuscha TaxID=8017 RepID=UPI001EAE9796|nr:cis-aconitate decarboxylase-like [Oncorhynchus gorbuscha]
MLSKVQRSFRPASVTLRRLHQSALDVVDHLASEDSVTDSFGRFIQGVQPHQLTPTVLHRSKRMVLDSIGVGLLGSTTHVFQLALQHCQHMYGPDDISSVYGRRGTRLSPTLAAFVNGVAAHSMDFDDTWHPATHPSGAVLPALLAVSDMLPSNSKPSGRDFLLAFNVGIEIQGRLMRFSNEAHNIPKRFHPLLLWVLWVVQQPAPASFLWNTPSVATPWPSLPAYQEPPWLMPPPSPNPSTSATQRLGLEAALLASRGLEASPRVLDDTAGVAGFSAFYEDYAPQPLASPEEEGLQFLLENQDIGFKRFPAHLGMHWVADAAAAVHKLLLREQGSGGSGQGSGVVSQVQDILLRVPRSKYIDRPFPESEHEARHSFQFNACSALLDGEVTVDSFSQEALQRPDLYSLLGRVHVEHPHDNPANFDRMYGEVQVRLVGGDVLKGRCDTFYGHWRNPLTNESLRKKFRSNAGAVLPREKVEGLIEAVEGLDRLEDCCTLLEQLQ